MRNLRGKKVLVTGGAQGIGFRMALGFAREGAEIVLSPAVTFGEKSERLWDHEFA